MINYTNTNYDACCLIPKPQFLEPKNGVLKLHKTATVFLDESLSDLKLHIVKYLQEYSTCELSFVLERCLADILIVKDDNLSNKYELEVNDKITIIASNSTFAFYALQTLRELLFKEIKSDNIEISKVKIIDFPRYAHRSMLLDIARHMITKEEIFKLIDNLARLKINYLHIHLCDDQGFRVEIEKYPLINKISSYRNRTVKFSNSSKIYDEKIYGGFYTKSTIREIVSYAKENFIEVIPEIDLPGHMVSVISAYPNLSCQNKQIPVREIFGISEDILCAGNPDVYAFVEDILREVSELFPCKYFHIGGDEAPKKRWKNCAKCQNAIKEKGLKSERELQGYMFNHFADFLKTLGKTTIGWNECLSNNLSSDVICQHWSIPALKQTVKHANNNRKTIMSHMSYYYLDHTYAFTPLKKTYNFEPVVKGIKNPDSIMGVECTLWAEWITSTSRFEYQLYPRLLAFADRSWNDNGKNFDEFLQRKNCYEKILDKQNISYAKGVDLPKGLLSRIAGVFTYIFKNADKEFNNRKK